MVFGQHSLGQEILDPIANVPALKCFELLSHRKFLLGSELQFELGGEMGLGRYMGKKMRNIRKLGTLWAYNAKEWNRRFGLLGGSRMESPVCTIGSHCLRSSYNVSCMTNGRSDSETLSIPALGEASIVKLG